MRRRDRVSQLMLQALAMDPEPRTLPRPVAGT